VELPTDGDAGPERLVIEHIEQSLAERYGGAWQLGRHLGRVRHGITYRSIEVEIYRAERAQEAGGESGVGATGQTGTSGFFDAGERRELPLSSLVTKVLEKAATEKATTLPLPSRRRRG
jgi:hypothetical protein